MYILAVVASHDIPGGTSGTFAPSIRLCGLMLGLRHFRKNARTIGVERKDGM
jgi:hypothetical protein